MLQKLMAGMMAGMMVVWCGVGWRDVFVRIFFCLDALIIQSFVCSIVILSFNVEIFEFLLNRNCWSFKIEYKNVEIIKIY